jgi:hypothetical protein
MRRLGVRRLLRQHLAVERLRFAQASRGVVILCLFQQLRDVHVGCAGVSRRT